MEAIFGGSDMEWAAGKELPCAQRPDVFDNPALTDFDPDNYLECNPKATEAEIQQSRTIHNLSQHSMTLIAKGLCNTCPVLAECRQWVLKEETNEKPVYGVVGGLSERERFNLRKGASKR